MKNLMKPALFATIVLCAILTGCKKEETTEDPRPDTFKNFSEIVEGGLTEDRPKRPKGKVKSNSMVDIAGAAVYLYTVSDSTLLDSMVTDTYGNFESEHEITAGPHYVVVRASGYETEFVSFTVPLSLATILDLGIIILEPEEQ